MDFIENYEIFYSSALCRFECPSLEAGDQQQYYRAWVNGYTHLRPWNVIPYPLPNSSGG